MRGMRMYLASSGLDGDTSFLQRSSRDGHALYVLNARDAMGERRELGGEPLPRRLAKLGYRAEELDLRTYFDADPDERALEHRFEGVDLVWVAGGNSFVLARAMRQARFSRAIARPLREGRLTYGGCSAGACVAGPDLQCMELMNDPSVLPDGYDPDVEPETLGLVPFRVVPHWRSDDAEGADAERVAARLVKRKLDHRTLRDGEVITFG